MVFTLFAKNLGNSCCHFEFEGEVLAQTTKSVKVG